MKTEQEELIKKVNMDKAKNKTTIALGLLMISILTYVVPLIFGEFDFGIIFEVIAFVFLIIARSNMERYDETRSKRYNVCAMIPVGWILIYDFMIFCSAVSDLLDVAFLGYHYLWAEVLCIGYMFLLFSVLKDLAKADNPTKYEKAQIGFMKIMKKMRRKQDKKERNSYPVFWI